MRNLKSILRTTIILASIFAIGCKSQTKIYFPKIKSERLTKENLKDLIQSKPNPSVVLRIPNVYDRPTSNTINNDTMQFFFSSIEKELLKQGIDVRDRGLFNESIKNSQTSDYSKMTALTNTDIILEIVNINRDIKYNTNKITQVGKKGQEKEILTKNNFYVWGTSIEYKVILVKTNEVAGIYKFYSNPCSQGCPEEAFIMRKKLAKRRSASAALKEYVVEYVLVDRFITESVKELVKALKE